MSQFLPPPLRRPPPPPVRHLGNGGGKPKPEMPLENLDDEKRKTTPTTIESLPDDDLITILVKLPAQDIHDAVRLVCRRWYRLIRSPEFIHTHMQSSPAGILIRCESKDKMRLVFVGMSGGRIQTYKLRYKFIDMLLSSCNGLILLYDGFTKRLVVANPATKQHCFIHTNRKGIYCNRFTCLGYVAASKEYKLVHASNMKQCCLKQCCAVLTMGVDDSWRHISTEHLSNNNLTTPVVTEGFVHWVTYSPGSLVTLDLETEIISNVPLPDDLEYLGWCYCLSAGKCLSFVNWLWPKGYCWEVWEMRPGPVAVWNKLQDVNLEGKLSSFGNCNLEPVGWIKYKEVLLFVLCSSCKFVAYNVCTKGIEMFELDLPYVEHQHQYAAHTNSLVPLDEGTLKILY